MANLRKTGTVLRAILVLAVLFGIANWVAAPKVVTVDLTEVALVDLPTQDWQFACFSSAYASLAPAEVNRDDAVCRSSDPVPEGWTYLTFRSRGGSCERFRFPADFLVRHGWEGRCFSRDEHEDIQMTVANGIVSLR